LYSSQLVHWRAQYREGAYHALRDDHRGRKRKRSLLEEENERLRNQVARLERRLNQAETIIEFQKTISEMLGIPLSGPESDGRA
jgi:cell shape-determining protein MreC